MRRILSTLLVVLSFASSYAGVLSELSDQDKAKLESGDNVTLTVDKEGATWPEIKIYRKVKASPDSIVNLFLDYEHANTYIENLVSAKVESSPSANTKDVRYTVKLPILFSVSYLVRNAYEKQGDMYVVRWNLLESLLAKSAKGSLRVEPYGDGSLICYSNHVEPATRLVAGLRNHAIKEASKTVDSIAKEAQRRYRSQKK